MPPLEGQTVVVTGAAQGLGAAVAVHLAELGARLILMDRCEEGLAQTVAECPGARGILVDLASAEDTDRAAAAVLDEPVGALIHNAAILPTEPLTDTLLATFQATMNVGIQAGFQLAKAVWPGMVRRGGGALVFVSSRSGIEGFANETAYCAAKHALEGFSKCLALEGDAHGIVSVTITPGMYMRTPMSERTYPPELRSKWVEPAALAPAFARIVRDRPPEFNGRRLDAWALANAAETPP